MKCVQKLVGRPNRGSELGSHVAGFNKSATAASITLSLNESKGEWQEKKDNKVASIAKCR